MTAALAVLTGVMLWLIPASLATGGVETYLHATVGQFEWRFGRPGVSVLGSSMTGEYLLSPRRRADRLDRAGLRADAFHREQYRATRGASRFS